MNQVADATLAAAAVPGKTIFGQPRGLATLFLTEMWERFTYYGMRGVLILCMVDSVARGGLGIDDKTANNAYGLYVGSTYLFGLLGGWIADRLIGSQRAVIGGSLFIIAGNLMLTFGRSEEHTSELQSLAYLVCRLLLEKKKKKKKWVIMIKKKKEKIKDK